MKEESFENCLHYLVRKAKTNGLHDLNLRLQFSSFKGGMLLISYVKEILFP